MSLVHVAAEAKSEAKVETLNDIKTTPRDAEVLTLLVQECSTQEIARQLKIGLRTVKQHHVFCGPKFAKGVSG